MQTTYSELVARVLDALHPSVDDVDTVVLRVFDELVHEATETRQVGRDGRDTHDGALGGSARWEIPTDMANHQS